MAFKIDKSAGNKAWYFEIKNGVMYIYGATTPGIGYNYGLMSTIYRVKGSSERTDMTYCHESKNNNYYGDLRERVNNMFNVPNLRIIDYIKIK